MQIKSCNASEKIFGYANVLNDSNANGCFHNIIMESQSFLARIVEVQKERVQRINGIFIINEKTENFRR